MSLQMSQEGLAVASIARDDPSPLPPEIPASSHPTIQVRRCQYVAKTSVYPSMQRYTGSIAPCDHNAQTSQTDRRKDRQTSLKTGFDGEMNERRTDDIKKNGSGVP